MNKDTRTAWAQEFDEKRQAWYEIDSLKKRIAELINIVETQPYPSMGDGHSGDYVTGYERAIFDILNKFKGGAE
jgi:Txe/YoeB family toxin of Txe-Axe toxin-antitoxin module